MCRNLRNDRATPAEIALYYQHYVTKMGLEKSFACGTTVTSVSQVSLESGCSVWMIQGLQRRASSGEGDEVIEVPFSVYAENVVLATGTHDIPARLSVEGENLPFVCHSFWELEDAISSGPLGPCFRAGSCGWCWVDGGRCRSRSSPLEHSCISRL